MTEFLCDLFSALAGHLVGACFAWGFFKRRLAADKALAAVRQEFEQDLVAEQNRRNTQSASFYDLILKIELSQEWMEIRTRVECMKKSSHFGKDASLDEKDTLAVRMYLNHYECVAMAIQEEIIPQELYLKLFGGAFVLAWKGLGDYVEALREREKRDGLYRKFQDLATDPAIQKLATTEPKHPTEEES